MVIRTASSGRGAWLLFAVLTAATLFPLWLLPWFVTQDGPAHLYNSQILLDLVRGDAATAQVFTADVRPYPNWAGHGLLVGLLAVVPPMLANKLMDSICLVGVAAAAVWLHRVVNGAPSLWVVALAWLFALNRPWILGFRGFLLGVSLYAVVLGLWWCWRENLTWRRAAVLAALLVLVYLCHPVPWGLAALGVAILGASTSGSARRQRMLRTAAILAPAVPLLIVYVSLMLGALSAAPTPQLPPANPPFATWVRYAIQASDFLILGEWQRLPLMVTQAVPLILMTPSFLAVVAGVPLLASGWAGRGVGDVSERWGWWIMSGVVLLAAIAVPDNFGQEHGTLIRFRLALLAAITLLPLLRWPRGPIASRLCGAAVVAALVLQYASFVDFGRTSNRLVGNMMRAAPHLRPGDRVGTLLSDFRAPFTAQPLIHADNLFGVLNRCVIWKNYQSEEYYFPVRIRSEAVHPPSVWFRDAAGKSATAVDPQRREMWTRILTERHLAMDRVLVWGRSEPLDEMTRQWFEPIYESPDGLVRVFVHRGINSEAHEDSDP